MIGLLLNDEADIAISSTSNSPFRREVVDFNFPTTDIRVSAFFHRPPVSLVVNPLTRPFNFDFWLAVLITILVSAISLCFFTQILRSLSADVGGVKWSRADCFQWSLATMCFQGYYALPKKGAIRIVLGTILLTSVIVYGAYGGTLLSFLFVQLEPINTMEELLAHDFRIEISDDPVTIKGLFVIIYIFIRIYVEVTGN